MVLLHEYAITLKVKLQDVCKYVMQGYATENLCFDDALSKTLKQNTLLYQHDLFSIYFGQL